MAQKEFSKLMQRIKEGEAGDEAQQAIQRLTVKQKLFCLEYMVDKNATKAALRAGYSKRSAGQIGVENMGKPLISITLKALLRLQSSDLDISEKWALTKFREIALRCSDPATYDAANANRAVENIAKFLGMFVERKEIRNVSPDANLSLSDMKRLVKLIEQKEK